MGTCIDLSKKKKHSQFISLTLKRRGVELFSRMTMHQQTALPRLISRNLVIELDDDVFMGYEFEYNVDKAVILATPTDVTDD